MPFDQRKIISAILDAMTAVGEGDASVARELADAVAHFLHERHPHSPLTLDAIHDMVEQVLMETGHWAVARTYVLQREHRARERERIRVRTPSVGEPLRVEGGARSEPWERDRIVRALVKEADLEAETAERVAEAVEERVLRSNLTAISTSLIRELVDNELLELGHTASLKRQTSLALPKYDLEKTLFRGGDPARDFLAADPEQLSRRVGDAIIRQYVLEEVYPARVREAHGEGALHLHELDRSLQVLRSDLDLGEEEGAGSSPDAAEGLRNALRPVRELLGHVAEELRIHGLEQALLRQRLREEARRGEFSRIEEPGSESRLGAWSPEFWAPPLVSALEELRSAREGRLGPAAAINLVLPLRPRWVSPRGRQDLFAGAPGSEEDPALFLGLTLLHALRSAAGQRALAGMGVQLRVSSETFRDRRHRELLASLLHLLPAATAVSFRLSDSRAPTTLAGKATVNLPRIAREVLAGADLSLEARLAEMVRLARQSLCLRASFLRRLAVHPDGPWARLAPRLLPDCYYAVGVVGLDEMVQLLHGTPRHESPDARRLGLKIVDIMRSALDADFRQGDPPIRLEETVNRGHVRRLALLDGERTGEPSASSPGPYSSGVRVRLDAPVDPMLRWSLAEEYRGCVDLEPSLAEAGRLRPEGPEVLLAFLEEACRRMAPSPGAGDGPPQGGGDAPPRTDNPPRDGTQQERTTEELF